VEVESLSMSGLRYQERSRCAEEETERRRKKRP